MIFQEKKSVNAGPSCGTGEGVAHSKRWYVALVRMHHEKKVSERLSKMGIDSFVPVQQHESVFIIAFPFLVDKLYFFS